MKGGKHMNWKVGTYVALTIAGIALAWYKIKHPFDSGFGGAVA